MDAYRFPIYTINRDFQILDSALTNSAHVLITSVSICSFSLTATHIFSVTFKSRDQAGQVVPRYFLLVQHCAILEYKMLSIKSSATKGHIFASKICTYFWKSILLIYYQVLTKFPIILLLRPRCSGYS